MYHPGLGCFFNVYFLVICNMSIELQIFVYSTATATIRPHLKNRAVPSQNLPVRLFDKAQPSVDAREERKQRRLSLAAAQAEESEWFKSLWNCDVEQIMTTKMPSPDSIRSGPKELSTVVDHPAGKFGCL